MSTATHKVAHQGPTRIGLWSRLTLPRQYALASLPVLVVGMLGLGSWVTRSIEEQVIQNTAVNATLFVNSFITPELQELATSDEMSEQQTQALDLLLSDTPLGRRILSVKVWLKGGRIGYYTRHELVGETFEPTPSLKRAWAGEVSAELSSLEDEEDSVERRLGVPLLEVYLPVRQRGSERVIAVAEFYQDATSLVTHLNNTRSRTWLVFALITLATYGTLFGIVHAGGRLIHRQDLELRRKVGELSELLEQNEHLRVRIGRATGRVAELNEHQMRRLSADLHDGPAQALGLALLRLDDLSQSPNCAEATADSAPLTRIRETLQEALTEIRLLCRGLTLPELRDLSAKETLERVVGAHQRRTNTAVELTCEEQVSTCDVSMPTKITAYRVVQEALTNSFRHAYGRGQRVHACRHGDQLQLTISDDGDGMEDDKSRSSDSARLGLKGLRERVESLGGQFEIHSGTKKGTTVVAWLPLETGDLA